MKLGTIAKITLAFSACFVSVVLLMHHEFARARSAREFAVAVGVWGVGISIVFLVVLLALGRKNAPRIASDNLPEPLDPVIRRQRLQSIVLLKGAIALLLVGLLTGLSRARNSSVWATLVGVGANLLLTAFLVRVVIKLQKTLR